MKDVSNFFARLLLLSFLIHLLALITWYSFFRTQIAVQTVKHVTISLQQKKPDLGQVEVKEKVPEQINQKKIPKKEVSKKIPDNKILKEDIHFLPNQHRLGDQMESTNQDDKSQTEVTTGANISTEKKKISRAEGGGVVSTESDAARQSISGEKSEEKFLESFAGKYNTLIGYDDETNDSEGSLDFGIESTIKNNSQQESSRQYEKLGNYKMLSDNELDSAFVKDPFSEKKANELKLINKYYEEISKVIYSNWTNPLSPSELKTNVLVRIMLEFNDQGYLVNAMPRVNSIYPELDQSLLLAIQKSMNHRFSVPSYLRQYQYLMLTYSSDGTEYELMPFEKEAQQATAKE